MSAREWCRLGPQSAVNEEIRCKSRSLLGVDRSGTLFCMRVRMSDLTAWSRLPFARVLGVWVWPPQLLLDLPPPPLPPPSHPPSAMGLGRSRHPCEERDCGCVNFGQDNYGETGAPQRCGCGHLRSRHRGLADATVDDTQAATAAAFYSPTSGAGRSAAAASAPPATAPPPPSGGSAMAGSAPAGGET
jgi:hypothetical protein